MKMNTDDLLVAVDLVGRAGASEFEGWWRNAVMFTPDAARKLAAILIQQAELAEGANQ